MRQDFDIVAFEKHKKQIDESNLSGEMSENASILGFYVFQHGQWKNVVDNLKLQLQVRTSQITLDAKASGAKSTAKEVEAMVSLDAEALTLEKSILKASNQMLSYHAGVEAIKNRGQMLQSIGSNKRAEMDMSGGMRHIYTGSPTLGGGVGTAYGSSGKIAAGTITSAHITSGSITHDKMSVPSLTKEEIMALMMETEAGKKASDKL